MKTIMIIASMGADSKVWSIEYPIDPFESYQKEKSKTICSKVEITAKSE